MHKSGARELSLSVVSANAGLCQWFAVVVATIASMVCNVTYRASPHSGLLHSIFSFWGSVLDARKLFGKRLAELRKAKGWSQEMLSLESGVARSYLGGVERGQRNIALINICRLAEALDVKPSELFVFDNSSG